jgi:hypothetical protein
MANNITTTASITSKCLGTLENPTPAPASDGKAIWKASLQWKNGFFHQVHVSAYGMRWAIEETIKAVSQLGTESDFQIVKIELAGK